MAKSKKKKHEQEKRSEEEELEDEDELDEDELDEDELDEDEDEYDEDEYEEEEEEEEEEGEPAAFGMADEPEDPFWWTPHLALSVILIVSLLGFFGLFNPWLGFLAPHHGGGHEDHGSDAPAETAAPATAAPAPEPPTPAKRQAAQDVMGARHILVAYKGAMRARPEVTRTKEEAQKRAGEAAAKAKKLGKPDERVDAWGKLVTEYSDEPGADKRGGDLGRFRKGSFHKDFVAGTEKLKVGEISGPVESPFGFHIIWRTY